MRPLASRRMFAPWRASSPGRGFLLIYNGASGFDTSKLGAANSKDGITFTDQTPSSPAIPTGAAGSWESTYVGAPMLLKFGPRDYRLWYHGSDGTTAQIGYATSPDGIIWTKSASNPVVPVGGSGAWDHGGIGWPYVYYEPSDVSAPFKMWYVGGAGPNYPLGYAHSTDGITWVKGSTNPVLSPGAAYDSVACSNVGPVVKVGATYNLYYAGRPSGSAPVGDQLCIVSFTDPQGTYTKSGSNPILSPSTAIQNLTADLASGAAVVTVADTSAFHVGEPCLLFDTPGHNQAEVKIQAINSGTQLTLTGNARRAWTVANGASIRSAYTGALNSRPQIYRAASGQFVMPGVAFQQFGAALQSERSVAFISSALLSGWAFDYSRGFLLPLGTEWHTLSAENPTLIDDR